MTLCQKCLAEDVIIRRSGYRPVCPGCGASGYLSYLYECGFCGTEKTMNGWCENPSCNSLKKRLIENAYFFLFPVRPYYKGLFRYKFILYPYTLFFGLVIVPTMVVGSVLGIIWVLALVYFYSSLTKRAVAKEEARDKEQRKKFGWD